jgi:hypothetical protein
MLDWLVVVVLSSFFFIILTCRCQSSATCLAPGGNLSSCSSGVSFGSSIDCFNCQGSFFPCANNLSTSIFLIIFYGLIILVCAKITSMGAEMLLELYPNRGSVIGALLLPILGSFPDACMIVASGALGTVAEAQEQLNVGIGALAGSTVMLLTLPWTAVLFAGTETHTQREKERFECLLVDLQVPATSTTTTRPSIRSGRAGA